MLDDASGAETRFACRVHIFRQCVWMYVKTNLASLPVGICKLHVGKVGKNHEDIDFLGVSWAPRFSDH